jgi:thioredoxin reductase (NADPH)
MQIQEVAIIGAGPAGLATALQLKRYGVSALLFERERVGGLLWNANLVENYPGFPCGISGPDLVQLFIEQSMRSNIEVVNENVLQIISQGNHLQIVTNQNAYFTRIVVIASGTKPKTFLAGFLPDSVHDKVFYEVFPLLDRIGSVAIVGAGDAAFDYALNLAKNHPVAILNKDSEVKCLPLLMERCLASPAITYYEQTTITSLSISTGGGIDLQCMQPSGKISLHTDYLLGAIGRQPQLDFMPPPMEAEASVLMENGRLYFVGDVKNGCYRQTAIAVGNGIQAAMRIYLQLKDVRA